MTTIYYNKKAKSFSYSIWTKTSDISKLIVDFLSKNERLQTLNDNSKGNTVKKIVGLLADDLCKPAFGNYKCPRCGSCLTSVSSTKTDTKEIAELTHGLILQDTNLTTDKLMELLRKNGL